MADEPYLHKCYLEGNSVAVRLPAGARESAEVQAGDLVAITTSGKKIVIQRAEVSVDE